MIPDTSGMEFFSCDTVRGLYPDCRQFLVIGERSCGKTYAVKDDMLNAFYHHGRKSAYVRRLKDSVKAGALNKVFTDIIRDKWGEIFCTTYGFDELRCEAYRGSLYLNGYVLDGNGEKSRVYHEEFCYCFSLSTWENDKGGSYELPYDILYDEGLTRQLYLQDEVGLFINVVSTLTRTESDCYVWVLGNTVSKLSPWDKFLGIKLGSLAHGETKCATVAESKTGTPITWAVHRCKNYGNSSAGLFGTKSRSSAMEMITTGSWQSEKYTLIPPDVIPDYKPALEVHFISDCIDIWTYLWGTHNGVLLVAFKERQVQYALKFYVTCTDNPYGGFQPYTYYRFNFDLPQLRVVTQAVKSMRWLVDTTDTGEQMRSVAKWVTAVV